MKTNTPKLRFPEFKNSGDWKEVKIGNIMIEVNERNNDEKIDTILSISNDLGFIKQDDYFEKRVASKDTSNYKIVRKGQLAYNPSRINVGSIAILEKYDVGIVSPMYIVIECNKSLNNYFFKYWIQTDSFKKNMYQFLSGGVRSSLPYKNLIQIFIRIPNIEEQIKIANCFSSLDKLIELEKEKLNKLQEHKKGLMQQFLTGKKRFPGFNDEWKTVKLGEIGNITSAGVDKKHIENEKMVYLLNYMDVYRYNFLNNNTTKYETTASEKKIKQCDIKKGDIFITPSSEIPNDIAHTAVALENIQNTVYSYHIMRIRPKNKIDLYYSKYMFETDKFYKQAYSLCAGSGQRYVLSIKDMKEIELFIPASLEEQKAIANTLKSLDDYIENTCKKIEKLDEHKKGLLQKLFI